MFLHSLDSLLPVAKVCFEIASIRSSIRTTI
jgi:hypothetical protein